MYPHFSSIVVGSVLIMQLVNFILRTALTGPLTEDYSKDYEWAIKLCLNCFGYLTVAVPGIIIYKYTKATKYIDRKGKNNRIVPGFPSNSSLPPSRIRLLIATHKTLLLWLGGL